MTAIYPPSAEHQIAIIEHGALTGRDGALRFIEVDFHASGASEA